jgi:hypothetical protein
LGEEIPIHLAQEVREKRDFEDVDEGENRETFSNAEPRQDEDRDIEDEIQDAVREVFVDLPVREKDLQGIRVMFCEMPDIPPETNFMPEESFATRGSES